MAKKGFKNALLSIYEEWRGVEDGLKVFKATNLVRCVVLQTNTERKCTVSHDLHVIIKFLSGGVSRLLVAYRAKQD